MNFAFFVIRDISSVILLNFRTNLEQNGFTIATKAKKFFQQWMIYFCALNEILMNFKKMIDNIIMLMTDMLREMNIENMIMKSYNHNNYLMSVSFIKMNTLVNTVAKLANTYYISSTMIRMICITSLMI